MNGSQRPAPAGRGPLLLSLAVVLVLATLGSFSAGFGVMTDCTNTYSCTVTDCRPCRSADAWLDAGWIAQGVLLVVAIASVVRGTRHLRPRVVRGTAILLVAVSVALFVGTTTLAVRSF